jgi:DNA mismatch repair protein MutS
MYSDYGKFYREYTKKYGSKTAIFLMVGAFYELYDIQDNATGETAFNIKDVADFLGITVTIKKDVPSNPNPLVTTKVFTDAIGLFAGFPDYTLHKHAGRLTSAGWTVVVIDQVKDVKGKVLDRKVSRILSPSTHVEAMPSTDTPYLTLVVFQPTTTTLQFGLATLDLTTGSTITYSSQAAGHTDVWTADDLQQQLCLYPPKELLVFCSQKQPLEESFVRRQFSVPTATSVHIRTYATFGTFANPMANADYLRRTYSIQSLLPVREFLSLRSDLEEIALMYLLQFAEEHMPSAMKGFQRNNPWIPEQSLLCGNHALQQLQMDAVCTLFSSCITPMGKRDIKQRLLRPLTQASLIQNRLRELQDYLSWTPEQAMALDKNLRFIGDLPRIHRKLQLANVTSQDFVTLGQSYSSLQTILRTWPTTSFFKPPPDLQQALKDYVAAFETHVDNEKALRACGSEDVSPFTKLYGAVAAIESAIEQLLGEFEALRSAICGAANLSPELVRLEAREKEPFGLKGSTNTLKALQANLSKLPKGTHINALKSGGWIDTPALQSLNTRLLSLRQTLSDLSREALLKACQAIADEGLAIWNSMEEWVSHLDCTRTIARIGQEKGWTCPQIDEEAGEAFLELRGLRHPLVTQTRVAYVQHDVDLGSESNAWLVYGMNASGKSTLMKAVGIAVLLAQSGSFVPAQAMRIRPFQSVYTRILNQDNLAAGLSSFAVEMSELRDILRQATENTLVLGDELCSGTESVSAMALVAAGIQWLTKRRAKFIFATHLHDLPNILDCAALRLKVWHLHVEYDPVSHKLVYDRTLMPGSGSTLYGLEVARAMDLPLEFLEHAQTHRHSILQTTKQQDAPISSYNSVICRTQCELCSHPITADLEVHHIQQQALATNGILPNGVPMNDPTNLVTLCAKCHDNVHAGEEVLPLVQTSDGPERLSVASKSTTKSISKTTSKATKTSKWSEEELEHIQSVLQEYKKASLKNLSYRLKTEYQIDISPQSLGQFRRM